MTEPTTAPTEEPASKNIVEIAVEDGRFTALVATVQPDWQAETLTGEGPFTVFAPTDHGTDCMVLLSWCFPV
jgi:uncharacterized surface protein with fasciclin (FAS1) repeats